MCENRHAQRCNKNQIKTKLQNPRKHSSQSVIQNTYKMIELRSTAKYFTGGGTTSPYCNTFRLHIPENDGADRVAFHNAKRS